jgi:hypothetical protein
MVDAYGAVVVAEKESAEGVEEACAPGRTADDEDEDEDDDATPPSAPRGGYPEDGPGVRRASEDAEADDEKSRVEGAGARAGAEERWADAEPAGVCAGVAGGAGPDDDDEEGVAAYDDREEAAGPADAPPGVASRNLARMAPSTPAGAADDADAPEKAPVADEAARADVADG